MRACSSSPRRRPCAAPLPRPGACRRPAGRRRGARPAPSPDLRSSGSRWRCLAAPASRPGREPARGPARHSRRPPATAPRMRQHRHRAQFASSLVRQPVQAVPMARPAVRCAACSHPLWASPSWRHRPPAPHRFGRGTVASPRYSEAGRWRARPARHRCRRAGHARSPVAPACPTVRSRRRACGRRRWAAPCRRSHDRASPTKRRCRSTGPASPTSSARLRRSPG